MTSMQHLSLAQAVRAGLSSSIAFTGAGGKTTAMFQLARELTQPVIVTATSHLGRWQTRWADQHIITQTPAPLQALEHGWKGITLITGELSGGRTNPINDDLLRWLHQFCRDHAIPLLIEADGSREKPLKAWADHEPPVPAFADLVVHVVGLRGLGKPLKDEYVHRAERFAELSGLRIGEVITPDALTQVLKHPAGGQKNIPVHARKVVLLNQADTPELQSLAKGLSQPLLASYGSVIIASLKQGTVFAVYEPVAGIVLAAGQATRFGQPKQLLDWRGEPFVRAVAKTALLAGLSPVVVVTGAYAEPVESAVSDLDILVIQNEDWKSGQASSIKTGVKALTSASTALDARLPPSAKDIGGAIFLLADQPQLTTSILHALVQRHAEGLYPVIAPMVIDQRANPVLFDRVTFPDLLTLEGDVGGRAVFHKHRVEYLPWHDDRLLLDVDTPEMYQRLLADDTL
jgi:molybdenum cofactor cytidylyltransferase